MCIGRRGKSCKFRTPLARCCTTRLIEEALLYAIASCPPCNGESSVACMPKMRARPCAMSAQSRARVIPCVDGAKTRSK